MLPESLLDVLVCPRSRERLIYFPRGPESSSEADACLVAPGARLSYKIVDGVPCLLAEEATVLSAEEADRLVARARTLGLAVPA